MKNYIYFIIIIILIIFIKSNLKKIHKKKKFIIVNRKLILNKVNIYKNKKVIILNNILNNPHYCLKFLINNFNYLNSDPSNYPGNRINTPIKLKKELIQLMLLMNKKYYKFKGNVYVSDLFFSIINKPKNQLTLKNVFPHRDCIEFNDHKKSGLALVIYLCKPNNKYGGTKIYNSKYPIFSKEFRTDKNYKDIYNKYINLSNNLSYDTNFSEFFDLIYNCKLEFNKGIIYPTDYFHKADVTNSYFDNNYSNNNPRYTLTGFLFFDKNKKSDVYNTNNDDKDFKLMNDWYTDGSEDKVINPDYYL